MMMRKSNRLPLPWGNRRILTWTRLLLSVSNLLATKKDTKMCFHKMKLIFQIQLTPKFSLKMQRIKFNKIQPRSCWLKKRSWCRKT